MADQLSTDVAYKSFQHGSVTSNCQQTLDWINSMELKRDQIISISMCETSTEEGESLMTVVYRVKSLAEDAAPFDHLQFREFTKTKSWESQAKEAEDFAKTGCDIVSLAHSAKNVLNLKNQVMWFANDSGNHAYNFQYFKETGGDWDSLVKKAVSYLNKYIAPHQLVHVSFYEATHPNELHDGERNIYCTIVHTAGASPVELRSIANHNLPAHLYTKTVERGEAGLDRYMDSAVAAMNAFGGENGHIVASANETTDSSNGNHIVVVISW